MKTPQKPVPGLSKITGLKNDIWLKFENKHHFGSHKGRSIPVMINGHIVNGCKEFVISSSGNAALAALRAVLSHNKNKPSDSVTLKIFVGEEIAPVKFEVLKKEQSNRITVEQVKNPKQSAFNYAKKSGATWLRSSNDPVALTGYQSLAEELAKINGLSAVFIAASSGTSALGIRLGFKILNLDPQIHVVQTEFCHPIVNRFLELKNQKIAAEDTERSLADAIVDRVGLRKESVAQAVIESGGCGWIIGNQQLREATDLVKEQTGENISANGALSFAGLQSAVAAGFKWDGPVVCIVGGA